MKEVRTEAFPEFLYANVYGDLSYTKGNCKNFRYVLKKITQESHYIQDLFSLYLISGADFNHDIGDYLDKNNEVVVEYSEVSKTNRFCTTDPGSYYDRLAAYRVVGRNVPNPNRVFINQKTKDTLAKREKMAADIPMIMKVTSGKVTVNRVMLLNYLNAELEKKGYDPLPKNTTYVDVD